MATARGRSGYSDPWSIANALVGLFTFTVPRQSGIPAVPSSRSIQNRGSVEAEDAQKDVQMQNANIGPAGGYSSTSPIDQPPSTASDRSQVSPSHSIPGLNEDSVISWAINKVETGTPVNHMELYGLQSFLQKRHEPREGTLEPEVLDLTGSATASPSPSGTEPRNGPSFGTSSSLPSITSGTKPRKMLKRNPNGVLHWRGAGSARSRPGAKARVVRPAAGPSEQRADRIKRRRIAEETDDGEVTSGISSSESAPAISSNGNAAQSTIPTSASDVQRLPRASIRPVTVPSVPSPLRQVTNGTASPESRASSLGRNGASGSVQQRTHAATILTEIIESVTPPPKFTIDNPYQTEAPVKPDYKPKVTKRMTERREELARNEKEKEKEKIQVQEKKDYSAKSIIEATVPKGARRSRPSLPGNKSQTANGDVNGVVEMDEDAPTRKRHHVTVEDADDEEDTRKETKASPTKKSRVTVEEVDDDDEPSSAGISNKTFATTQASKESMRSTSPVSSAPKTPSLFGVPKHSAKPKEPSKLRTSIIPEEDDTTSNGPPYPSVLASVPPAAAAVFAQRAAEAEAASQKPATSSIAAAPPKVSAFTSATTLFPSPAFRKTGAADKATVSESGKSAASGQVNFVESAKETALRKNKDSLPKYHFEVSVQHFGPQYADAQKVASSRKSFELPQFAFDKPLPNGVPSTAQPKSDTKSTSSPASSTATPAPPPVQAFNWAAAGLAPKPKPAGGSWTCGTCMLSNPASATDKCTVCESPR